MISNMGVIGNAGIASIASLTVATISTTTIALIASKQYQIGKRQLRLAKDKWERFEQQYIPCEVRAAAILWSFPEYIPFYLMTSINYRNIANMTMGQFNIELRAQSLCMPNNMARRIALHQSAVIVDAINLAYRTEDNRAEAMSDLYYNRRAQFLNLGRDLNTMSAKFAALGTEMLGEVRDKVQDMGSGLAQGLQEFGRYQAERTTNRSAGDVYASGMAAGSTGLPSGVRDAWDMYKIYNTETPQLGVPPFETNTFAQTDVAKGQTGTAS